MKAAVFERYGGPDEVHVAMVPVPRVRDDQMLVRVLCASITTRDVLTRSATFPLGLALVGQMLGPRVHVLGDDFAGVVETVGALVTQFRVGDAVAGHRQFQCHAEYVVVDEAGVVCLKPGSVSYADAACAWYGASPALNFLRDQAKVLAGESVLVVGASGAAGASCVQLAKVYGAHVTALCTTTKAAYVRQLGADCVMDYAEAGAALGLDASTTTTTTTTTTIPEDGATYDVIVDTVGDLSFAACEHLLNEHGRLCLLEAGVAQAVFTPLFGTKRVCAGVPALPLAEDLRFVLELVKQGKLAVPIDREFALDEISDAHRYVDEKLNSGTVVVMIA